MIEELSTSLPFVLTYAFAAIYASIFWGFFAFIRFQRREWLRFVGDLVMSLASIVVAIAYLDWVVSGPSPVIFGWVRLMVVPIFIIPVTLHLSAWKQARNLYEDLAKEERERKLRYQRGRDG